MSTIDVILSVFIFIFFIIGYRKGFIATIIHLAAFVLYFGLIAYLGPFLKGLLILNFNIGNTGAIILAYLIIFLFIFFVSYVLIKIITKILKALKINWINRLLGGFLGVINAIIIIAILFLLFTLLPVPKDKTAFIKQSQILKWVDAATQDVNLKKLTKPDPIDKTIKNIMKNKK
jgi:membrane protein required for colicin V production